MKEGGKGFADARGIAALFLLAAVLGSSLIGCLDPVYTPGNIYDTKRILHDDSLSQYEIVEIDLVEQLSGAEYNGPNPASPSRISLYYGSPDTLTYPVYTAEEGKTYFVEVKGWKEPYGYCYAARFTEQGSVVENNSCSEPPKFWLDRDTMRLYVGGPPDLVTGQPLGQWPESETTWGTSDGRVATEVTGVVTPMGTGTALVTPVGPGTARIVGQVEDTVLNRILKDTVIVQVVLDVPKLEVGPDTIVTQGDSVIYHVGVNQEFGGVKLFAWDADGDGVFEDTLTEFPSQTYLETPPLKGSRPGDFAMHFLVRDGEGNEATATKTVHVKTPGP